MVTQSTRRRTRKTRKTRKIRKARKKNVTRKVVADRGHVVEIVIVRVVETDLDHGVGIDIVDVITLTNAIGTIDMTSIIGMTDAAGQGAGIATIAGKTLEAMIGLDTEASMKMKQKTSQERARDIEVVLGRARHGQTLGLGLGLDLIRETYTDRVQIDLDEEAEEVAPTRAQDLATALAHDRNLGLTRGDTA